MRRTLVFLHLVLLLASSGARAAEARTTFLLRQLEKASDPRARAQAALMLGASGNAEAAEPLCKAALEPEALVRTAALQALARLPGERAQSCLRAHPDASSTRARQAEPRAPILYIQLAPVNDRSKAHAGSVLELTESELRNALTARGALLAPTGEGQAQATQVLRKKKLRGFYLMTHLDALPGNGVRMTLVCFTYPGRALLGEVSVKASGPPPPDLVRALIPRAVQEAAETFEWPSPP